MPRTCMYTDWIYVFSQTAYLCSLYPLPTMFYLFDKNRAVCSDAVVAVVRKCQSHWFPITHEKKGTSPGNLWVRLDQSPSSNTCISTHEYWCQYFPFPFYGRYQLHCAFPGVYSEPFSWSESTTPRFLSPTTRPHAWLKHVCCGSLTCVCRCVFVSTTKLSLATNSRTAERHIGQGGVWYQLCLWTRCLVTKNAWFPFCVVQLFVKLQSLHWGMWSEEKCLMRHSGNKSLILWSLFIRRCRGVEWSIRVEITRHACFRDEQLFERNLRTLYVNAKCGIVPWTWSKSQGNPSFMWIADNRNKVVHLWKHGLDNPLRQKTEDCMCRNKRPEFGWYPIDAGELREMFHTTRPSWILLFWSWYIAGLCRRLSERPLQSWIEVTASTEPLFLETPDKKFSFKTNIHFGVLLKGSPIPFFWQRKHNCSVSEVCPISVSKLWLLFTQNCDCFAQKRCPIKFSGFIHKEPRWTQLQPWYTRTFFFARHHLVNSVCQRSVITAQSLHVPCLLPSSSHDFRGVLPFIAVHPASAKMRLLWEDPVSLSRNVMMPSLSLWK